LPPIEAVSSEGFHSTIFFGVLVLNGRNAMVDTPRASEPRFAIQETGRREGHLFGSHRSRRPRCGRLGACA